MKKPSNVKELCEYIWELEDKYNLLDFEINGVKPWQAHRIEIYYELGKHFGVFEKHYSRGMSKIEKIKSLNSLIKNSILHSPLSNLKKVDYLIFSHPRSKIVDNESIDIYSHYFIQDLIKENKNFFEFEGPFEGKHIREFENYKKYLDYIMLYRNLYAKFMSLNLSNEQYKIIKNIIKETGFNNLENILIERTKKFIPTYKIYKKILEKIKPEEIYVVVSYGRAELIKAAKDLGIKTIEFQHGTFSKYHLGYSYPNYNKELDYFPNEFWVWNDYWKNLIKFPKNSEIKIYPFRYLEEEKRKYDKISKIKNQLVVLGQGGVTDRMAKKILDNIGFFKKFKIIFKLHPEEYSKWNEYKNLKKLQDELNIEIVENIDLYKLLAKSESQAGVFSTALYEGVEFGCKTILFNLPGIEYMDKFIEMYEVKVL